MHPSRGWSADNVPIVGSVTRRSLLQRTMSSDDALLLIGGALYSPHFNEAGWRVSMVETLIVAACALVDIDGRVLIARRPAGKQLAGLWEFPGGKMEAGETPEACLIRELAEELGIEVTHACLAPFVFTSHAYPTFHLLMPLFLCRRWEGFVSAREHVALAWVKPHKLADYPMPPADAPLVAWLRDFL